MDIQNDKLQNLISIASKNLGITENELKEKLKNKNFNNPMVNNLLNNPEKAKAMLEQPNIKKLVNKFLGVE
mgnify:CR=1 FL=1